MVRKLTSTTKAAIVLFAIIGIGFLSIIQIIPVSEQVVCITTPCEDFIIRKSIYQIIIGN